MESWDHVMVVVERLVVEGRDGDGNADVSEPMSRPASTYLERGRNPGLPRESGTVRRRVGKAEPMVSRVGVTGTAKQSALSLHPLTIHGVAWKGEDSVRDYGVLFSLVPGTTDSLRKSRMDSEPGALAVCG